MKKDESEKRRKRKKRGQNKKNVDDKAVTREKKKTSLCSSRVSCHSGFPLLVQSRRRQNTKTIRMPSFAVSGGWGDSVGVRER